MNVVLLLCWVGSCLDLKQTHLIHSPCSGGLLWNVPKAHGRQEGEKGPLHGDTRGGFTL